MYTLDKDGNELAMHRDFHIVSGVIPQDGKSPTDVYSKNGARPVYGPQNIDTWKPPAYAPATISSPTEDLYVHPQYGQIYVSRINMTLTIYNVSVNKIPNLIF